MRVHPYGCDEHKQPTDGGFQYGSKTQLGRAVEHPTRLAQFAMTWNHHPELRSAMIDTPRPTTPTGSTSRLLTPRHEYNTRLIAESVKRRTALEDPHRL